MALRNMTTLGRSLLIVGMTFALLAVSPLHVLAEQSPLQMEKRIQVRNLSLPHAESQHYFRIGDRIEMILMNFPNLKGMKAGDLLLYINGLPMEGLHPVSPPVSGQDGAIRLTFLLEREKNETYLPAWDRFYRHPRQKEYPVKFSLGTASEELTPRSESSRLELVKPDRLLWTWLATAGVAVLLLLLARNSNILKEDIVGQESLFSLSRSQIAWWTLIILGSFLHLYVYIGEIPDLSDSTMALLGISAATLVGAKSIDHFKVFPSDSPRRVLPFRSRGFLLDILSDGKGGISVHRFQFVVWTLALTFVFIRGVLQHLSMPVFGSNLLLLMGISNGTYLLLKLPENNAPAPRAQPEDGQAIGGSAGAHAGQPGPSSGNSMMRTPSVTTDGEVVYRQEEDMGEVVADESGTGRTFPRSNRAMG